MKSLPTEMTELNLLRKIEVSLRNSKELLLTRERKTLCCSDDSDWVYRSPDAFHIDMFLGELDQLRKT